MALAHAKPLARHFTVYVVNRKRGLQHGESMSDIAGHLATAIEHDLGESVFLDGVSTGGSVALQLAVDRPDLVRRLVLIAAAHRLGPRGRGLQAEVARLIRAGEPRDAWASMTTAMLPGPLRGPARPLTRLVVGPMVPDDPTDVLVTPGRRGRLQCVSRPAARHRAHPRHRRKQGPLLHRSLVPGHRRRGAGRAGTHLPRLGICAGHNLHGKHPPRPRLHAWGSTQPRLALTPGPERRAGRRWPR